MLSYETEKQIARWACDPLLVLIVSFVPGLLWLLYFYRRDVYEPEPMHLVVRCFVFGILAVIPVGLVEAPFQRLIEQPSGIVEFLAVTIIVIGLTEETAKFLAAKLAVPDKTEIDEVVDGIVYLRFCGPRLFSCRELSLCSRLWITSGAFKGSSDVLGSRVLFRSGWIRIWQGGYGG